MNNCQVYMNSFTFLPKCIFHVYRSSFLEKEKPILCLNMYREMLFLYVVVGNPFFSMFCLFLFKVEIFSRKGQELLIEVWDYDPGFPGVQNDDYLGR